MSVAEGSSSSHSVLSSLLSSWPPHCGADARGRDGGSSGGCSRDAAPAPPSPPAPPLPLPGRRDLLLQLRRAHEDRRRRHAHPLAAASGLLVVDKEEGSGRSTTAAVQAWLQEVDSHSAAAAAALTLASASESGSGAIMGGVAAAPAAEARQQRASERQLLAAVRALHLTHARARRLAAAAAVLSTAAMALAAFAACGTAPSAPPDAENSDRKKCPGETEDDEEMPKATRHGNALDAPLPRTPDGDARCEGPPAPEATTAIMSCTSKHQDDTSSNSSDEGNCTTSSDVPPAAAAVPGGGGGGGSVDATECDGGSRFLRDQRPHGKTRASVIPTLLRFAAAEAEGRRGAHGGSGSNAQRRRRSPPVKHSRARGRVPPKRRTTTVPDPVMKAAAKPPLLRSVLLTSNPVTAGPEAFSSPHDCSYAAGVKDDTAASSTLSPFTRILIEEATSPTLQRITGGSDGNDEEGRRRSNSATDALASEVAGAAYSRRALRKILEAVQAERIERNFAHQLVARANLHAQSAEYAAVLPVGNTTRAVTAMASAHGACGSGGDTDGTRTHHSPPPQPAPPYLQDILTRQLMKAPTVFPREGLVLDMATFDEIRTAELHELMVRFPQLDVETMSQLRSYPSDRTPDPTLQQLVQTHCVRCAQAPQVSGNRSSDNDDQENCLASGNEGDARGAGSGPLVVMPTAAPMVVMPDAAAPVSSGSGPSLEAAALKSEGGEEKIAAPTPPPPSDIIAHSSSIVIACVQRLKIMATRHDYLRRHLVLMQRQLAVCQSAKIRVERNPIRPDDDGRFCAGMICLVADQAAKLQRELENLDDAAAELRSELHLRAAIIGGYNRHIMIANTAIRERAGIWLYRQAIAYRTAYSLIMAMVKGVVSLRDQDGAFDALIAWESLPGIVAMVQSGRRLLHEYRERLRKLSGVRIPGVAVPLCGASEEDWYIERIPQVIIHRLDAGIRCDEAMDELLSGLHEPCLVFSTHVNPADAPRDWPLAFNLLCGAMKVYEETFGEMLVDEPPSFTWGPQSIPLAVPRQHDPSTADPASPSLATDHLPRVRPTINNRGAEAATHHNALDSADFGLPPKLLPADPAWPQHWLAVVPYDRKIAAPNCSATTKEEQQKNISRLQRLGSSTALRRQPSQHTLRREPTVTSASQVSAIPRVHAPRSPASERGPERKPKTSPNPQERQARKSQRTTESSFGTPQREAPHILAEFREKEEGMRTAQAASSNPIPEEREPSSDSTLPAIPITPRPPPPILLRRFQNLNAAYAAAHRQHQHASAHKYIESSASQLHRSNDATHQPPWRHDSHPRPWWHRPATAKN